MRGILFDDITVVVLLLSLYRKAVKATVILFPLLGMAHILLFFKPHQLGEAWEMAYRVIHAIFQASQVNN